MKNSDKAMWIGLYGAIGGLTLGVYFLDYEILSFFLGSTIALFAYLFIKD